MDVAFLERTAVCKIRRNNPTVFKRYSSRYRWLPIQLVSTWWPGQACGYSQSDSATNGSHARRGTEIRALQGDARYLPIDDQSYDIVFLNSIIEYVGDFQDQIKFAREARRVGKRLWIQTPARSCPIEPHYLGLFIHWFPQSWHAPLARWASIRGINKSASIKELSDIASNNRLLNKHEFESLFPDCDIVTEKLLFIFPKSYIAIRKN